MHISVHFPGNQREVERVADQVEELGAAGIRCGVNLLVQRRRIAEATRAAEYLRQSGIDNRRIVYLPMRAQDTPTPWQIAEVAGERVADGRPWQSMSCLLGCARSERFCSVDWRGQVAWCSYTRARRQLETLSAEALFAALSDLKLEFCGGSELIALTLPGQRSAVPGPALARAHFGHPTSGPQHGHRLVRGRRRGSARPFHLG